MRVLNSLEEVTECEDPELLRKRLFKKKGVANSRVSK